MRIRLALVVTVAVVQFGRNYINAKMKMSESHFRVSLPNHSFSGSNSALMKKLRSSEQEPKEINKKREEVEVGDLIYNPNVDNSIFKGIPEGERSRILLQSDTVLKERQPHHTLRDEVKGSRKKRQVLKGESIWEDGVFYTLNTSDETVQRAFIVGTCMWAKLTCVDFVEDNTAKDKVVVVESEGYFSAVGRAGGTQYLSLVKNSAAGSAVHEIGHVLGLLHTMARYDRDSYITIEWENPNYLDEFEKLRRDKIDVYGLKYDYGSIMHYDAYSGSINRQPTMIAADSNYQMTMGSDILSFSDIFTVNMLYGCNKRCNESTSAKCVTGFPHPRNCSICICPSGFGGDLCDRRPSGCGEYLDATEEKQTVRRSIGAGSDLRYLFDFCYYMILAPQGMKIELEAKLVSDGFEIAGCTYGGIEIKAQTDQKIAGYRFCSRNGTRNPIISGNSYLPVILFNRKGEMKVLFTYRLVQ